MSTANEEDIEMESCSLEKGTSRKEDAGAMMINHAWWEDNCFVIAKSVGEMDQMIREMTVTLRDNHFEWKPSSPKMMVAEGDG